MGMYFACHTLMTCIRDLCVNTSSKMFFVCFYLCVLFVKCVFYVTRMCPVYKCIDSVTLVFSLFDYG